MGEVRIDGPEFDRQIEAIAVARMASLQRRIANQARADTPVRTGNLGRSVGEGQIRVAAARVVTGSVHATAEYAAAVHEGRRAGVVIVPRRAKALRFVVGGRVVFAARVVTGAVKARPFLRNAALRIVAAER